MVFFEEPEGFRAEISVVACYVLHDDKFILLQRQPNKTHGGKWGLPAGKVEEGENELSAIVREVIEETGITLVPEDLSRFQTLWVRNNGHDFLYHTFYIELDTQPTIVLDRTGHQDYVWISPKESLEMDLIHDLGTCNKFFLE